MSLVIVNPSPKRRAKKAKRKPATPAPKKAAPKGVKMAKRRMTPARRRAFRKMIAANPHRRRRRVHNPAPRRAIRRRYHNPSPVRHRRRYRNPGGGNMIKELMSADGMIMIATIAAWPTVGGLLMTQFLPTQSGYAKYAIQAGIGVGLGFLVHKFVHKEAGKMLALVSIGNGIAQEILVYQGLLTGYQQLGYAGPGSRVGPHGFTQLAGYARMGLNDGNLNGVPREPGRVNTSRRIQ
jgi:hypothetical protein